MSSQLTRSTPTPSTPASGKQTPQSTQGTPVGTWRHPKFDEITRRQYATTFDERNVRQIVNNALLLLASFIIFPVVAQWTVLRTLTHPLALLGHAYHPYTIYALNIVRLLFVANIVQALVPLYKRLNPDQITDIPLTPSQRLALGLDPNVKTPQTPGSAFASPQYITPPRYQLATPRSGASNQGESPLSGSPRASMGNSTSNSPYSPRTGSPMFQKALNGSASRRLSYDRNSPSSGSFFGESSSSNTPGTPTPAAGRASVGLNNKWLYEKGRSSPRSSLFS